MFTPLPFLLADRAETLRDLGSGFRGEQATVKATDVLLIIGAVALLAALFWLLSRYLLNRERHGAFHSPNQLFRKLSAAHGLSFGERRLLVQAARCSNLPLAAGLFVRPDLLESAGSHPELAARAGELVALRRKLFGN